MSIDIELPYILAILVAIVVIVPHNEAPEPDSEVKLVECLLRVQIDHDIARLGRIEIVQAMLLLLQLELELSVHYLLQVSDEVGVLVWCQ